ncbi:MAG: hypothetical protein P8M71_10565 [Pseudomonadales bacterium]|nr:hypothetical protein [Pseudomonadales bacterium]
MNYKTSYRQSFDCSEEKLFSVITEPGNLQNFHPFCQENIPIEWSGDNAVDKLTYLNGKVFTRKITRWHDCGYDLTITHGNIKTNVEWNIIFHKNKPLLEIKLTPLFLPNNNVYRFFSFYFYVKPQLTKYLKALFNGLSFYISTG